MEEIYLKFIEYTRINNIPFFYIDKTVDYPYIIYKEEQRSNTYLLFRKTRTVAHIHFFEIEYYEEYDEKNKNKQQEYINHFIGFLECIETMTSQEYVIIRRTKNRVNVPINLYGDVIFPTLQNKYQQIHPLELGSLYVKDSTLQYAFFNKESKVSHLVSDIRQAQKLIDTSIEHGIITDFNVMEFTTSSRNYFRYMFFSYKNRRIGLFFMSKYPLQLQIVFGDARYHSAANYEFKVEEHRDLQSAIEQFLFQNRLLLLFDTP